MAQSARSLSLQALQQWEEGDAFADEVLHRLLEKHSLPPLERAFLTELFYGILRNLSRLDHAITLLRDKPVDERTLRILRLGLHQILHLRTPDHAAVNETVALAGASTGLVNAIFRRAIRERDSLVTKLDAAPLAVRTSHPEFLLQRWTTRHGVEAATALAEWNNQPSEVFARVNTLRSTRDALLADYPEAEVVDFHPLALRLRKIPPAWIEQGLCYIQDPSTLLATDLLDPQPRERVLDVCAAPGGKTTHIAQCMQNEGTLIACDYGANRVALLQQNIARLGVEIAGTMDCDWTLARPPFQHRTFDRILVDAPCSNTGVLRRRVDARWRLRPEDFTRMPRLQTTILNAVIPFLKPGGTLVYSTCSLEPEENEKIVEAILERHSQLELGEVRRSLPLRDGFDGAFAAKLVAR